MQILKGDSGKSSEDQNAKKNANNEGQAHKVSGGNEDGISSLRILNVTFGK
jgi:hypothetical protein